MTDGLSMQLQGAERIQQALARAPEVVRQELSVFTHAMVNLLTTEVVDRTPTAFGKLRGSITGEVKSMADGMLGVIGTPQPYAVPVELGTKPHMPPIYPWKGHEALEDWVRQKLGVSGADVRRVAYLVARKISKKGTPGHFMFRDAFNANAAEVQRQFDQTVSRIVARI